MKNKQYSKSQVIQPLPPASGSVRRMARALNEMCIGRMGIGLSNANDEARIIMRVASGKTYKQAEREIFPE